MTDLILIAALVGLVALARAYVWACEALAPDEERERGTEVAALVPLPLLATVGVANWAGLVIAALLFAYLLFTLLAPERFK